MSARRITALVTAFTLLAAQPRTAAALGALPDGRVVTPVGFTIPVEGFASSEAMSPDAAWLAVLSQDGGAIDILALGEHTHLAARLSIPWATGIAWTSDGLYVSCGFAGTIARYSYSAALSKDSPSLTKRDDIRIGGLLNGIAEDPASHRIVVARTAATEVVEIDDRTGDVVRRLPATGQPFSVGMSGSTIVATLYDSAHIDVWRGGTGTPVRVSTGPHPTQLLVRGSRAYVANADGRDVALVDIAAASVVRRFDLTLAPVPFAGQTPSGMALSADAKTLFVAESGFNDLAVVDVASGKVVGRIPTGWYPMAVIAKSAPSIDDDPRDRPQLWVLSAQGFGPQPDPGSEWDGVYTGFVQHLVAEPGRFAEWTRQVEQNNHFNVAVSKSGDAPPIRHVVFIVEENKHFDEEFGDERGANADPALLLYGRKYTPNAHALAERYTLFDDFMGDGQASIYGHSWTTQGFANDYLTRNAHTPDDPGTAADRRVAYSIWPYAQAGEDTLSNAVMDFDWFRDLADLPKGPRVNVSAVFGPRGELIDELQRKGLSYRVYGEQMTMLPDGRIAAGLAQHAAKDYPGAHIDLKILDTVRAKLFLDDVAAHGLAAYSYLTLPTNHTAGSDPGYYTPASFVANNDFALGEIIQGLSKRADWRDTVVFVTMDDPQGTGDHLDSHRMPAFAMGPYIRRSFVDHTHYDIPSILRTVEVLYGLAPLNLYDAQATPMLAAFADTPDVSTYTALPMNIEMVKNPGPPSHVSIEIDGPDSAAIPAQEWASLKGRD